MIVGICLIKFNLQNTLLEFTVVNDANIFDTDVVRCQNRSNGSNSSGFIDQVTEQLVNRTEILKESRYSLAELKNSLISSG